MSRRPSEPGHFGLYKRSNGIYYFYIYDAYGKRKQYSTGKTTKTKAQDYVTKLIIEGDILKGNPFARHRFSDLASGFYDYESSPYIKAKLARGYSYSRKLAKTNQSALERHIMPYFGTRTVESISKAEINEWLLELPKKENIAHKTANTALTILRQILDYAVEQGTISDNPAKMVKPLSKTDASTVRRVAFTQEQIRRLFSRRWENRSAMVACMLSATTGMRYGEIRALQWSQIHDDYIEVDASFSDDDGRKCTKSGWGRIVPLHPQIRILLMSVSCSDDYVFTYDGEHPVSKNFVSKALDEKMDELGIKAKEGQSLSFHSFRHYFNSRLVASGISGEKVRAVIGHEDESMTEHYLHLEVSDFDEIKAVQQSVLAL